MEFRARMPRDIPKEGRTRVVFSIKTSRGNRLELDGEYDEAEILKLWTALCGLKGKQKE
jgi:hypothetical protein